MPVASDRLSEHDVENLERIFKALADQTRVIMLSCLTVEENISVGEFSHYYLSLSQSRASYHLKQLTDAGLIERHPAGNYNYYRLVDGAFERLASLFAMK